MSNCAKNMKITCFAFKNINFAQILENFAWTYVRVFVRYRNSAYYHTTELQYYHTTMLPYYHTTILRHNHTTTQPYYHTNTLPYYNTIKPPYPIPLYFYISILLVSPTTPRKFTSLCWHWEGKQFVCSLSDGSLCTYNMRGSQGKFATQVSLNSSVRPRPINTQLLLLSDLASPA